MNLTKKNNFTLKKDEKIKKRTEFIKLKNNGKKINYKYFKIEYLKNNCKKSRIGITITKKVVNAAKRNKIKRYIREYYRLNKNKLKENWDFNLIVKHGITQINNKKIFTNLKKIFINFEK